MSVVLTWQTRHQPKWHRQKKQRRINIDALRRQLLDLQAEGIDVAGLSVPQLVILLQQGALKTAPIEEGGDILQGVQGGLVVPRQLIGWAKGDDPEPPISTTLPPDDVPPVRPTKAEVPGDDHPPVIPPDDGQPARMPSLDTDTDPANELRFLDADTFASADDEAVQALVAMSLHRLWERAYRGQQQADAVVAQCATYAPKRPWTTRLQQEFLRQYQAAIQLPMPSAYAFTVDGQPADAPADAAPCRRHRRRTPQAAGAQRHGHRQEPRRSAGRHGGRRPADPGAAHQCLRSPVGT